MIKRKIGYRMVMSMVLLVIYEVRQNIFELQNVVNLSFKF